MNSEQLIKYLQKITLDMFSQVASADLLNDESKAAALKKIDDMLAQFGLTVQEVLPAELLTTYFQAVEAANVLLVEAGVAVSAGAVFTKAGKIAEPFQKLIHLNAVAELVENSMGDMSAAIRTAQMSGHMAIEETLDQVRGDIAKGLIVGDARKTTQKRVMSTFLQQGLTAFVTVDNKSLPLDFYAQTVVRTKMRTATVSGSTNRYKESGVDLVVITGNGDSCAVCSQFNGMVISLEGKTEGYPVIGENGIRLPPFHPNCRCGCRPFVLSYATPAEIDEGLKRNAKYAPGKDQRTAAQKQSYEREQKARVQANAEKKQFMRWQNELGADAPKTLGAFRRMKRANTPKFQELQSNYRSAMARGRKNTPTPTPSDRQANGLRDTNVLKTKIPKEMPRRRRNDFDNEADYMAYREARTRNSKDIEMATQNTIKEIRERPQFRKTKPEIETYLRDNFFKKDGKIDLDLDGIDPEVASLYCEMFDKVSADFPQIKNKFTSFGLIKDGSGGLMQSNRGIGFGHGKLDSLVKHSSANASSGYTIGNNLQDLMIHEMGHNVDSVLGSTGQAGKYNAFTLWKRDLMDGKDNDFAKARNAARNFDDDAMNMYSDRLSAYGYTNQDEYFAEAFSGMYTGSKKPEVESFRNWITNASAIDQRGGNRLITDKEFVDGFSGNKKIEGIEYP